MALSSSSVDHSVNKHVTATTAAGTIAGAAVNTSASPSPRNSMEAFAKRHCKIKPFSPYSAIMESLPRRGSPEHLQARQLTVVERRFPREDHNNREDSDDKTVRRPASSSNSSTGRPSTLRERIEIQRKQLLLHYPQDRRAGVAAAADQIAAMRGTVRRAASKAKRDPSEHRPGSALSNSALLQDQSEHNVRVVTRALSSLEHHQRTVPPLFRRQLTPVSHYDDSSVSRASGGGATSGADHVVQPHRKLRIHHKAPSQLWEMRKSAGWTKEKCGYEGSQSVVARVISLSEVNEVSDGGPVSPSRQNLIHSATFLRVPTAISVRVASEEEIDFLRRLHVNY